MTPATVKILIAEDDPAVAQVLHRALNSAGYNVVRAADGHEVLRVVELERPDIILLDVQMPLLQGVAAVLAVRRIDLAVPIMMMTGSGDPDFDFQACYAAGAHAVFIKPFRIQALMAALRAVLDGRPVPPGPGIMTPG